MDAMQKKYLVIEVIKVGYFSFIMSKILKGFGQDDISSIIKGTGYCICGFGLIILFKPMINTIDSMLDKIIKIQQDGNILKDSADFISSGLKTMIENGKR